ncbi:uncharacterized protein [Watersipora subatra]|uniref:uncharacterized protein n=1 Tax=Watersipora subatra TaxID=2589382 RepID=UPI00355AE814
MIIDQEYFWSDPAVALGYIKNSELRYHMFVANRVQTIRSNSECEQWHYVLGKANPADLFSRGEAEKIVIKLTQREYYRDELKALESSQSVHKQSSLLCLTLFLDKQGMMRIGGRARRSLALSFKEKHPLILPEKAHVSKLSIEPAYQKVYHQGQAMTLGALRTQGYWITAANKLVKRHIYQCAPCRAMRAPAVQQQMGELPQSRIEPTPPFTAIHIELLDSTSTDALINALRSFICIRGPVKTICCDNGTNFIGTKNELLASFASLSSGIQDALKDSMIEFKFNAPSASHAGGVWERQIRTVKSVLNSMLPTYTTRMDTMALKTAFYEVMAIVNSRLLSVDNFNKPDEIVLTPNHLITMKPSQPTVVLGKSGNEEAYGRKMCRKVFKDNDALVRRVQLRVANRHLDRQGKKMTEPSVLERPVQKLILLVPAIDS